MSKDNLTNYIIENYNLNKESSDFDFVYAHALFNSEVTLHTAWNNVENRTKISGTPIYAHMSYGSILCGEFVDITIKQIYRVRKRLGLPPLEMEKVYVNGHVTMQYYDNQHNKCVFVNPDLASSSVVFVSDAKGFYATIDEIKENIDLILLPETIVFKIDDNTSKDCAKEEFYSGADELFTKRYAVSVLDTQNDLLNVNFIISSGIEIEFNDFTGDRYFFDTIGLTKLVEKKCNIKEFVMPIDSGCGEDLFNECLFEAMAKINGFNSLYDDLIPHLKCDEYYIFELGLPSRYIKRFTKGAETIKVKLKPGEFDSTNFRIPLILHKIIPEKTGIEFCINDKKYFDTFVIEKYCDKDVENSDSIFNLAQNQINELGFSASIPKELGSVTLEFYFNYNNFPLMHESQRIIVKSGEINYNQSFLNQK